jgi:cholestenol Delta-isomerase
MSHPYYPLDLELEGYLPNEWSPVILVAGLTKIIAILFYLTYWTARRWNPSLAATDIGVVMWFILCETLKYPLVECNIANRT